VTFIGNFFLLVVLLGLSERYLLFKAAGIVGFWGTVGLCVLTGVVGGTLVRIQGLRTLQQIQESTSQGRVPAVEMVSGVVLLLLGAMLIMPGFITDVLGFVLLIPAVRLTAARRLVRVFERRVVIRGPGMDPNTPQRGRIIDIEPDDESR
jgi:UPF0716 protein FxsA